jgi:hypothetical protein
MEAVSVTPAASPPKPVTLLVVGGNPKLNWYEAFKGTQYQLGKLMKYPKFIFNTSFPIGCKIGGAELVVEMALWDGSI